MTTFNLLDESWIPVLAEPDAVPIQVSLREALLRAEAFQEIVDPSPLVVAALHRLLLAVLHRVFGPKDADAWLRLWRGGSFDRTELRTYLDDDIADRFDLFDARWPFYQTAELKPSAAWPVARLAPELASKTDPTLFDHSRDDQARHIAAAEAARLMVSAQVTSLGGFVAGEGREGKESAKGAPLANAAMILLRGSSLFHTLMLNLVRYDPAAEVPWATNGDDLPAWERNEPTAPADRYPTGYLDWLTWQSRRIQLGPPSASPDGPMVGTAVVMKGYQLPGITDRRKYETMVAFVPKRDASPRERPWDALRFATDRSLWRDSLAIFSSRPAERQRPKSVDWLAEARWFADKDDELPTTLNVDVLGMLSDQKRKLLWRHERFSFPAAYLDEPQLVESLGAALRLAEDAYHRLLTPKFDRERVGGRQREVARPLQLLAEAILPERRDGKPDKDEVKRFVSALQVGSVYWPRLEAPFRCLLDDLPTDSVPDPEGEAGDRLYGGTALPTWAAAVREAACAAFTSAVGGAGASPRAAVGAARAEARFEVVLSRLIRSFLADAAVGNGGSDDEHERG